MHFVFKAQWAFTISILAIGILQKILSDPVNYQKYETVRDTVCYPCTWLQSSKSPHFPGWGTWTNPSQWTKRGIITSPATVIGTQKRLTEHEVLYKLGGNGPWIQRVTPDSPDNFPPESCRVEQVHMLSRHSERYPTKTAGSRHLALIERLKGLNTPLNGSLSFFNEGWTYFTDNPEEDFEQLTSTGPYAGTLGSFTTGVRFHTRYGHLLPKPGMKMRLWASDSKRVIDTARYFAAGLLGVSIDWDKNDIAEVDVIPETLDRGTDTLTPGDTCLRYIEDTLFGHDYGRNMLAQFQNAYIPPIARRLIDEEGNQAVGGFTNDEIYSMQEMCGFETLARGSSPWCDVFTSQDWDHFEYARDLIHFYRAGPGNTYAGAMGWLWLNATSHLLEVGPDVGTMFFSFVHDGDIAPMLTALNIFDDPKYGHYLPVTHIAEDRVWRTATVMPMGGRITFERLHCDNSLGEHLFVRININDDIVPLPDCHDGPGGSCPLGQFVKMVHERRARVGRFDDVCGTKEQETQGLSFLKQPSYHSLEDLRTFPSDSYSGGDGRQKVLKVDK